MSKLRAIQAEMQELQENQGESNNTSIDPFTIVIPRQHLGHVRLLRKGVTRSDLKASSSTNTSVDDILVNVSVDLVKSITATLKEMLIGGHGMRNASSSDAPTDHAPSFTE
ncbi:hypothetical protein Dimus_024996, partial [Dionaea muscipula]